MLYLNKTKIKNIEIHQEIYNTILNKFKSFSCYDQHGTMIFYDANMLLSHTFSKNVQVLNFSLFFSMKTHNKLYT
jgi:hypothetical protein